jgi:hypothetical protein
VARRRMGSGRIGIGGISGGQTALACDVAEAPASSVADVQRRPRAQRMHAAMPGVSGHNPIDIGATVNVEDRNTPEAFEAVIADEGVGASRSCRTRRRA